MKSKNKQPCVLVVDDDYYFSTDVLGYHLRRLNFNVIHAFTASDFSKLWQDADVILLDIRLPEREGEPIDPWSGLKTLDKIASQLGQNLDQYPQIMNCIIRSAQTRTDAIGANIKIPRHYNWFSPDISFSKVINTISEVAVINSKAGGN